MTFDEARKLVASGDPFSIAEVAGQMRTWHSAQLGLMLLAVQVAKEVRYNAPHPDYYNVAQVILERERKPRQPFARLPKSLIVETIEQSVELLWSECNGTHTRSAGS